VPGFDGPEPTATAYRVYGRLAEALGHRPDQRPSLDQLLWDVRRLRRGKSVACPTCAWPRRETVGLVCQTCGTDYNDGEGSPWTAERVRHAADGFIRAAVNAGDPKYFGDSAADRARGPAEGDDEPPTQLGQALAALADAEFHADQASLGDPSTGAPPNHADLAQTEALLAIGHALTGLLEARVTLTAASFNAGPR